ncbi:SGNH/GDSL hydrolase family protein [Undibacterium sp. SXout20W]
MLLVFQSAKAEKILFVGNSFTFGYGSEVQFYRADTVNDLNHNGFGGVPALFKSFTTKMGLTYDVALETEPGIGIDWHLKHKPEVLQQQAWDTVVLQSYSTLDIKHPGDPTLLVDSVKEMTQLLRQKNPHVQIDLVATWPRADLIYQANGAWYGRSLETMTQDIQTGYEKALKEGSNLHAVAPVGLAWLKAIHDGIAVANPYQAKSAEQIDLWTFDHYHASNYGYYLEALVIFGTITGIDPQALGEAECSGDELGMSRSQVKALQKVASEQLLKEGKLQQYVIATSHSRLATRCDAPAKPK